MISVLIPSHNNGAFLGGCVRSVLAQDYTDFEIVIAEDGSSDSSPAVAADLAAEYPDRIRVIATGGVGVSRARNILLDSCEGDFVTYLDSDDMLMPGALTMLSGLLDAYPDCGMASGLLCDSLEARSPASPQAVEVDAVDAVKNGLYQKPLFSTSSCGKLIRREVALGARFAEGRRFEDLEVYPRLCMAAGRSVFTDAYLYYYRKNPRSFITTWSPSRLDALWATEEILKFVRKYCPHAVKAADSRRFSALYNVYGLAVARGLNDVGDSCYSELKGFGMEMLTNTHVRMRNKLGAILLRLPRPLLDRLLRLQNRE